MLTLKDLEQIVISQSRCATLAPLPFTIDHSTWETRAQTSRRQLSVAWISFLVYLLLVGYKNFRLFVVLYHGGEPLHHVIMHVAILLGYNYTVIMYIIRFIRNSDLDATIMEISLKILREHAQMPRRQDRSVHRYTLQDLLAMTIQYLTAAAVVMITAAIALVPTMKHTFYSSLPAQWQDSTICYLICLALENRMAQIAGLIGTSTWQLQLIEIDGITTSLTHISDSVLQRHQFGLERCENILMRLRSLQLYLSWVNTVNRYIVFAWKMCCIGATVLCGYAAIAHFTEHPVFGLMFYVLFFDVLIFYALMYDKAFKIPTQFEETIRNVLRRVVLDNPSSLRRRALERQLKSIRCDGIKVGGFHTMERASTPILAGFVCTNIVNMLVTFG